ncbi:flagellar biosynthesis protein FlhF [Herbaspirillum sp. RTI4]|uniref:flagellar biosynthesis protein FlhF n=1 Tax=Herbaspirillum sp. RTI4 TaxID=3048640 RepID=UPI002AB39401|nr:flagellar biosynthesis protein FlhF [Herbaspirillum sp. RTI4]MDY7578290.1 flagellar biosynthesis protein FlhF [Herbaspirillum sp. RTI4]MEA9981217.1 flagellar biosynthesis protein FlhF [Herbaspirillum sp. RTI4]
MNVKKFVANSSREAWRHVRETLGSDAVILSNRTNEDGVVEILAMANEDMSSFVVPAMEKAQVFRRATPGAEQSAASAAAAAKAAALTAAIEPAFTQPPVSAASAVAKIAAAKIAGAFMSSPSRVEERNAQAARAEESERADVWRSRGASRAAQEQAPVQKTPMQQTPLQQAFLSQAPEPVIPAQGEARQHIPLQQMAAEAAPVETAGAALNLAAQLAAAALSPSKDYDGNFGEVMSEIRSMRGALETQLAEISWGTTQKREPLRAAILREMLAAGFSASLSRLLTEKLPVDFQMKDGLSWVKTILARNLLTLDNESDMLEKGGVFALVGPTGVGKTTTTAKLAARCVMRHGPGKLALITTDGYRIGAYEQLRIYGKILGVMVHSVKDEADLRIALEELRNKHTVLIDTAGMGQRDQMVPEQVAMLSAAGMGVKRLLCLNATATGGTLNEVVRAYQGNGLAGCIVTKLDEAATIGNVLDIVIRQKLNLFYVANGQRVPEDLHVANKLYLVDRAFKLKRETAPFEFQDAELPVIVGPTARSMQDKSLREVNLG